MLLLSGRRIPVTSAAQVIMVGETQASAPPSADDDPDLTDDEATAGAMWARANHPLSVTVCPRYSAAFEQGCAGVVAAKRP
jgi:hypothetical protein